MIKATDNPINPTEMARRFDFKKLFFLNAKTKSKERIIKYMTANDSENPPTRKNKIKLAHAVR